ncbi:hypothetical protein [Lignipirellula cremea]|uniref:Uncharacterized protein n=1 Tax=Lignipirellula cremea TaxID=2528010 RepID=A0A518DWI7_9BACT|nr:hypothetical protein [Lignipirellula cremea]QDU96200.1 hypothetical protein Pla8534_40190 [Lignipirellula cremea]
MPNQYLPRMMTAVALLLLGTQAAQAIEPVSLIPGDEKQALQQWSFDHGAEFPGAKGGLTLSDETYHDQPVLRLHGDFTGGGQYVQAMTSLPDTPIDTLSFWVNVPSGVQGLTARLIDGSGQCHQLKLKTNDKGGWQKIVLPVEEYFRKMGTGAALDLTSQYQKWSGANDGRWHQPGKKLVVLWGRQGGLESDVLFSDVVLYPQAPTTKIQQTISLDELLQAGEVDWNYNAGSEFKGGKGGLEVVAADLPDHPHALRLHADFTGGGAYVGMNKSLEHLEVQAITGLRFKLRSTTCTQYGLRLIDSTGQVHQRVGRKLVNDGKWHEVVIEPEEIAGGEHWGGAKDGKWHGPIKLVDILLNTRSDKEKQPDLLLTDIRADVVLEAKAQPAALAEGFDAAEQLGEAWRTTGKVDLAPNGYSDTKQSLRLQRSLEDLAQPTAAAGPAFPVNGGSWKISYAWRSDLHSPDNSYQGAVMLEVLDQAGNRLDRLPIGIGFGKHDWQAAAANVSLPQNAAQARFLVDLRKTYGEFRIDELSAARLSVQPVQRRIERILIASPATGNLFQPGETVSFQVTVETIRPLPTTHQQLHYRLLDFTGADQLSPQQTTMTPQPRDKGRFVYLADITLPADQVAVGKFYELHVRPAPELGEDVSEFSGLAVLPTAASKAYRPEQIPFTIRNWDSRSTMYMRLADRLGFRLLGVWGGWSSQPPCKAHLPGLEVVQELGDKWVTGTPASQVEREGFAKYSEESLRQGMKNFLDAYADKGLGMIALGNEPHGTGQKVLDNVRAYRAVYETVKAYDPEIHVIGTSVEPNEEYFKAGYQNYLDSYDFHIYEHYTKVRKQMGEYRALMKKYNAVKPLHSTELGLNSQGQTRLAVARELIKKSTVFFAEGGATVSWFTIMYPDPKGVARGQFGDAHCMFDCKYNLYNPRLDAVVMHALLNSICVKTFTTEKQYPDGVQAFLFRDDQDQCLQVLWCDEQSTPAMIPLPGVKSVELVRIDGSREQLDASGGGVTLTLSEDPVMLLYEGQQPLAESLGAPAITLPQPLAPLHAGQTTTFIVSGEGLTADSLAVRGPALWKTTQRATVPGQVEVSVTPPAGANDLRPRFQIQQKPGGNVTGELTVQAELAP